MKKITLLIITSLFASLLIGCGMKGPLYRAPSEQPENEEKVSAALNNAESTAASSYSAK